MGITGNTAGVKLTFMDAAGEKEIRPPITGRFSRLRSKERPESPGSPDVLFGSPDWLTDINLADDATNLKKLPVSQEVDALTSASSKRVHVRCNVGKVQTDLTGCLTIANLETSTQASPADRVVVQEIFVFPPETDMKQGHPFFKRWLDGVNKSRALKAARAA